MEENICNVCLGTAVLYCEQLKNFYCKNCNARRHSRFPSHCFSRISQIPLPKPSAGESIYMMYLYILNWKLWRTYSKVYTLISIGEEVDSAFLTGILATLGSKIGKRRWSRWKKCYCHPAYREWQKPLLPATTFCWCGHSSCHLPNTQPDTWPSGGLASERDSCHLLVLYTARCFSAYCSSKRTLQGC